MTDATRLAGIARTTPPPELADWERRLLDKARLLRSTQKGAKLIVEFEGPAMRLFVTVPAGKVE